MSRREEILREAGSRICGHRGMAGPNCCVLVAGHEGRHSYGEPPKGVEGALADRIVELEEKLARWDNVKSVVEELMNERDALRARCEDLEQDQERLDWLSEQAEPFESVVTVHSRCVDDATPPKWCVLVWKEGDQVDERGVPVPDGPYAEHVVGLRAALDAARAQAAKGEK